MPIQKTRKVAFVTVIAILLSGLVGISSANAAVPQINLCLAGNYATLSKVLTNAAGVIVRSDTPGTLIGAVSPVESDAFLHPGDNLVSQQSGADYIAAIGSLRNAIDSVKTNLLPYATILTSNSLSSQEIIPDQLGVYPAGIYSTTAAMSIAANTHITLTGGVDSIFVFISGEAFNVGANVQILLSGGAQAKNVYWLVGAFVGAETSGASSTLVGNFLVDGSMSVGASTLLTGRILAINTIIFGALAHLDALPPATSCGASVMSDTKSIEFTDLTLVDGIIGSTYSDFVAARTNLNGTPDNKTVTYSISPSPTGLGLSMSTNGVVTGTVSNSATAGTYSFTVSALSTGYVTQTYVYPLVIKAAVTPPVVDTKTIEFTDLTLVDGVIGSTYSDFVAARTNLNGTPDNKTVTYSISPSPTGLGLSMNTNGVVTGTISNSATAGTYSFTVSAMSSGYVTQTYVYPLVIRAAVTPPVVETPAVVPPAVKSPEVVNGVIPPQASPITLRPPVALTPPAALTPTLASYKTIVAAVNFDARSSVLSAKEKNKLLLLLGKSAQKVTEGIIIGYVQRDGNIANYEILSSARARAIAVFLYTHGVKVPLVTKAMGPLNSKVTARTATVTLKYKG
jgi:outer membrane protein OmpA-like peptidoglycan-associated protein